jgi:hypothetical protein
MGRRLAPGALIAGATQGYPGSDDYQGEPDDERASESRRGRARLHPLGPALLALPEAEGGVDIVEVPEARLGSELLR